MASVSKWPGDLDYIDAVQTPNLCFKDPQWRSAVFVTDDNEIPVAATGRSAIVFQAKVGSREKALRCFTREVSSQKDRYEKLSEHLQKKSPLGSFVGFTYKDREILVGEKRYPVVEMTWSRGVPLNDWVKDRLQRGSDLAGLAAKWLSLVNELWDRKIAHGDLANDNCLVNGSAITLVDYDSCFIPALAGVDPGEAGNVNFQHPRRDGYYARNMDTFPALVIYLSLLALSKQKSLWKKFHTGENLIFTATDYESPRRTDVWKELRRIEDPEVKSLTGSLAEMCDAPIASLPPLGDLIAQKQEIRWWEELIDEPPARDAVTRNPPTQQPAGEVAAWWEDEWTPEEQKPFKAPPTVPLPVFTPSSPPAAATPPPGVATPPSAWAPMPRPRQKTGGFWRVAAVILFFIAVLLGVLIALH